MMMMMMMITEQKTGAKKSHPAFWSQFMTPFMAHM